MSVLKKMEKEFAKDGKAQKEPEKDTGKREQFFSNVLGEKDYSALLDPNIKNEIKWFVEMLQDFYERKIAPADATYLDAIDYIPLFCINGALISSMMDIPYDEYLKLVDIMIVILNIKEE